MVKTEKRGFTLIELVITLAILLTLTGISVTAYLNIIVSTNENVCKAQRHETVNLYKLYLANGGDYDAENTAGMEFLVDCRILNQEFECPDGGVYLWQIDSKAEISISCTRHGELFKLNTPLGNNFDDITESMKKLIEEYYEKNGRYPRSWGEFAYSDIGLNSTDWDEPFEHIIYKPVGNSFSISPEEGYKMVVVGVDGVERVLKQRYYWSLWYDFISKDWYYKSISAENQIDIETLEILVE